MEGVFGCCTMCMALWYIVSTRLCWQDCLLSNQRHHDTFEVRFFYVCYCCKLMHLPMCYPTTPPRDIRGDLTWNVGPILGDLTWLCVVKTAFIPILMCATSCMGLKNPLLTAWGIWTQNPSPTMQGEFDWGMVKSSMLARPLLGGGQHIDRCIIVTVEHALIK